MAAPLSGTPKPAAAATMATPLSGAALAAAALAARKSDAAIQGQFKKRSPLSKAMKSSGTALPAAACAPLAGMPAASMASLPAEVMSVSVCSVDKAELPPKSPPVAPSPSPPALWVSVACDDASDDEDEVLVPKTPPAAIKTTALVDAPVMLVAASSILCSGGLVPPLATS
jgi:hypothetical protein